MLKDDFFIKLSYDEEVRMLNLATKADMDHYAHQLLTDRL